VAVINMRQHKLALCADHFAEWVPAQVEKSISTFKMFNPEDRILVAVSGGKDSLALWDILLGLGYQADGIYLGLGIDGGFGYSAESQLKCEAFLANYHDARNEEFTSSGNHDVERNAAGTPNTWIPSLHTVSIPGTYGEAIPEVAKRVQRGRGKPCSVCGLIKRHEMNRIAHELGYSVLATGHNLDDEAAVLFGNTMNWQVGYLARQGPVLPETDGFARKVKPLCRMYEREMIAHKELLAEMERKSPGAKQNFYLSFLRAKRTGFLDSEQTSPPTMDNCQRCGQPTTAPGLCAFCRLWMNTVETDAPDRHA
jgi:tRNA(Ile)-lysidine synthase TilS/MesJ